MSLITQYFIYSPDFSWDDLKTLPAVLDLQIKDSSCYAKCSLNKSKKGNILHPKISEDKRM